MDKMIFFNTAWMDRYDGDLTNDRPVSHHKFIVSQGWGGEILSFKPYQDRMYGYVETGFRHVPRYIHYTIHIEALGGHYHDASVGGVTAVWVSPSRTQRGTVVVGWYKDSAIYRKEQPAPAGSGRAIVEGCGEFFASAKASDCCLLPPTLRSLTVPRGPGGLGRSNVWYADNQRGKLFKMEVSEYIRRIEASTRRAALMPWAKT